MNANPSQLLLLCDHVKLSLLERKRAFALNLEPNAQSAEIARSLNSLKEGVQALEDGHVEQAPQLRKQYEELRREFEEDGSTQKSSSNVVEPSQPRRFESYSDSQKSSKSYSNSRGSAKQSQRYTDDPNAQSEARVALLPYSDDADDVPDHTHLDNQRIHQYHAEVMQEQDGQLDRLGESVSRQRDLSIQIGDELDEHVEILDDMDRGVMRHQTQLDKARGRLSDFSRKAKDNWSIVTIAILIVILLLLIILLKS